MDIREALHSGRPLLLDAAMGTELARRGADTRPPLWSARALRDDPGLVRAIHAENVAAGAHVLTANTFRLHSRNRERERPGIFLEGERNPGSGPLIALAVALARDAAAGRLVWVAGSLAPLEDCYRPDLVPSDAALAGEHQEMAEALAKAGCDLILVETMNAIRELVAATKAAVGTGLPVVASMVTDGRGHLLSGESVAEAGRALVALVPRPDVVGVNCVPVRVIGVDLARLRAAAHDIPLCVYANTGRALDEAKGLFTDPVTPEDYARLAAGWLAAGRVARVGGCCGTTAAHTAALRRIV
ncbi:MAG: homocysteine S-methyltransferase family protein [Thermoanaerobaculia bacterium]